MKCRAAASSNRWWVRRTTVPAMRSYSGRCISSDQGAIVSNGINTRYGDIDPYWMAASAIDEALRQVIAVGGNLKKVALLDNFCWGTPNRPEMLGALIRAAQACHDMALAYGVPFISGKDSLNNEFEFEGSKISIPPHAAHFGHRGDGRCQ